MNKKNQTTSEAPPLYTKEQMIHSARYRNRRDLIEALLTEGEQYTTDEADRIIEEYLKGRVK